MRVDAPVACIDTGALRHNLDQVRRLAGDSPVMAVVKANAYGHDVAIVAAALGAVEAMAVARVAEGCALRQLGFRGRIVVLEGAGDDAELLDASRHDLDLIVHHASQIELHERFAGDRALTVWLKIDTGMSRLGFLIPDVDAALDRLRAQRCIAKPVNLMTHLASADLLDDPMTGEQIGHFASLAAERPGHRSIANSAGLIAWPASRKGWVRPGIMLYGISPFADKIGPELDLRPAMRLETRLIATRLVRAGTAVGYCGTWTAPRDTWIGTAAIGYGDGYPGNLPAGTPVQVNGRRRPLAGRVSMDMITIDLGAEPAGRVGDPVVLWGGGLPVEEIAGLCGRLSYELVCAVAKRVPRIPRADAHG